MIGLARNAVAEAIATLLFVFVIIAALNSGSALAPFAIGFALMVLVYATGHISGGHLNPAVTFGAFIRGAIGAGEMIGYWIAQLVGGALGAFLALTVFPMADGAMSVEVGPSFIVEALFTFILVYVVLNSATSKDTDGNSFYGLAIGSVVVVGAIAVGGVSGASFNPAVALGLALHGEFAWGSMWMYVLAPLVGALLAGVVFRLLNTHDVKKA